MSDPIVIERLEAILEHITIINERMEGIKSPSDFLSKDGQTMFDAILMRLQAMGENIKKIESLYPGTFSDDQSLDINNIVRFRDIISHHYEKLDTEVIYQIVLNNIPLLKEVVEKQILKITLLTKKVLDKKNSLLAKKESSTLLPKKRIRNSRGPKL